MKSKLTKIILLITLAILPTAFAQAQTAKKTKKKSAQTGRATSTGEQIEPDKITVAPNTKKSRSEVAFKIGTAKAELPSETFKTESINKAGIGSLSVPSNMIADPVKEEPKKNGEVEWTTYRYEWKTPVIVKSSAPRLKAAISTTVFNIDLKTWADDVPLELRTPEGLVKIDNSKNEKSKGDFADNRIKETKIINVNGVDGAYILFTNSSGNFIALWQTYRLLDGKAQRIDITIEGDPSEISKAEQIIKSFRLSAK